jgi:uncharacterized protein YyaL (SSP411 family)
LVALDHATSPNRVEVAIVGSSGDAATTALIRAARAAAGPFTTIAVGDPTDTQPTDAAPLLTGRPLVDGAPAAYVCKNFTCDAPITDPAAVADAM